MENTKLIEALNKYKKGRSLTKKEKTLVRQAALKRGNINLAVNQILDNRKNGKTRRKNMTKKAEAILMKIAEAENSAYFEKDAGITSFLKMVKGKYGPKAAQGIKNVLKGAKTSVKDLPKNVRQMGRVAKQYRKGAQGTGLTKNVAKKLMKNYGKEVGKGVGTLGAGTAALYGGHRGLSAIENR